MKINVPGRYQTQAYYLQKYLYNTVVLKNSIFYNKVRNSSFSRADLQQVCKGILILLPIQKKNARILYKNLKTVGSACT